MNPADERDVTSDKTKKLFVSTHSKNYPNRGFQNDDGDDINLREYIKAFDDESNDTTFESEIQEEHDAKSESVHSNMFVTPQKDNVLSPPVVMRRVSENQTPQSKPLIPSTLFQSNNDSEYLDSIQNNLDDYVLNSKTSNTHEEEEDKEETSSMVSQYGSDVGEIKMRMEDIHTMDAVPEDANDEDSECEDEEESVEKVDQHENGDNVDRDDDGSIDSIDLSNHLENSIGIKRIDTQQHQFRDNFTPVSPSSKSLDVGSNKPDATPTTPIGAVSIALRNIGKGMSNIARASGKLSSPIASTSSPAATVSPKYDERYRLSDFNSHSHWLSPRFGNQRNTADTESIRQPRLTSSLQSSRAKSGATQLFGITQCLSFDPESGKLPYSNMRMTDSPPSSPLPRRTHRKTRSWGQGVSDFSSKGASRSFDLELESSRGRGEIPPIPLTPTTKENIITSTYMSPHISNDNEREDAKILLKIFVEQTLMYDKQLSEQSVKSKYHAADGDLAPKKVTKSILQRALRQLRGMIDSNQEQESMVSHQVLVSVLDELETSYEYAQEMKQAALSASAWLNSNDTNFEPSMDHTLIRQNLTVDQLKASNESLQRQLSEQYHVNEKLNQDLSICRAEIGRLRSPMSYKMDNNDLLPTVNKSVLDMEDEESNTSSKEDEVSDTQNMILSGDVSSEVADAKKEILLLKAELEETNKILKQMESDLKMSSCHQLKSKELYNNDQIQEDHNPTSQNDQDGTNPSIEPLEQADQIECKNDDCDIEDMNTSVLKDSLKTELDEYVSVIQESDRKKIKKLEDQIRCLESNRGSSLLENKAESLYETNTFGWKVLKNLAPPPDHDLRSPIVSAVLSEWNPDKRTQLFLLEWIEKMMTCPDPSEAPPLHISGLDDQLRDGFLMHILPFLSKRTDVDVEVSTRGHCKTFYDILIHVKKAGDLDKEESNLKDHVPLTTKSTQMMAFKASATSLDDSLLESNISSKVAHPFKFGSVHVGGVINKGKYPSEPMSPSSVEENHAKSNFQENTKIHTPRNSGLVAGALNAVGGLLSRRKPLNVNDHEDSHDFNNILSPSQLFDHHVKDNTSKAGTSNITDSTEDVEPYHRVVSAPPGRIGITFVQYRGHAMVSDVYPDSPLLGWIFPSDIVIAIDEIPVSGMRVPDIVKLLTLRKDRQRALRVISSHAMTDLIVTEK